MGIFEKILLFIIFASSHLSLAQVEVKGKSSKLLKLLNFSNLFRNFRNRLNRKTLTNFRKNFKILCEKLKL